MRKEAPFSATPFSMSSLLSSSSSSSFDQQPSIIPTNNLCSTHSPTSSTIFNGFHPSSSPSSSSSTSSSTLSLSCDENNLIIKSTYGSCDVTSESSHFPSIVPSSSSSTTTTSSSSNPIPIPSASGSLTPSPFPFSFGGLPSVFEVAASDAMSIPPTPEPLLSTSLPPAASNLPLNIQKQLCQNLFDKQTTEEENAKWFPMQRDFQHFLQTGQNPENLSPGWKEFGHRGSI